MPLFGKKKAEKKETEITCECGCECSADKTNQAVQDTFCCGEKQEGICCIKVLGTGCKSCHALYENAQKAVKNSSLNIEVEYITDLQKIMGYGIMSMPALVINEQVVSVGKVLDAAQIQMMISAHK